MKYNSSVHQYTERQMERRIAKMGRSLNRGGVDILVTHAPAEGMGDLEDGCHQGFACFKDLMDRFKPQYHLHGHVHLQYVPTWPRVREYGATTVVNASGKYFIELPDKPEQEWARPRGGLRGWLDGRR